LDFILIFIYILQADFISRKKYKTKINTEKIKKAFGPIIRLGRTTLKKAIQDHGGDAQGTMAIMHKSLCSLSKSSLPPMFPLFQMCLCLFTYPL
jgi:hypothetical protein